MNALYKVLNMSKQAVYQRIKRQKIFEEKLLLLLIIVGKFRKKHPGMGLRKIYDKLQPDFLGRDKFIEIFRELGYSVKRKRNFKRTTFAGKFSYPNLIKGMKICKPNMVWQSDITYYRVNNTFYYITFIIDVYTREIVGYHVSKHLRASANVKALKMALKRYGAPKIHHSDRGVQYGSKEYTELLKAHNVRISMSIEAW